MKRYFRMNSFYIRSKEKAYRINNLIKRLFIREIIISNQNKSLYNQYFSKTFDYKRN